MADPFSIITGVTGLVGTALKVLMTLNDHKARYQLAELTVVSMRAQCACVEMALFQVQSCILENPESLNRLHTDSTVARTFDSVFGACHMAFLVLNERLKKLIVTDVNERGEMAKSAKLHNMWNDQEMNNLLQNIQGQASGLAVVLSALQMRSNHEMHTMLKNRESKNIMKRIAEDASSLAALRGTNGRAASIGSSVYSGLDSTEFDFDFELINTATYRRALASAQRSTSRSKSPRHNKDSVAVLNEPFPAPKEVKPKDGSEDFATDVEKLFLEPALGDTQGKGMRERHSHVVSIPVITLQDDDVHRVAVGENGLKAQQTQQRLKEWERSLPDVEFPDLSKNLAVTPQGRQSLSRQSSVGSMGDAPASRTQSTDLARSRSLSSLPKPPRRRGAVCLEDGDMNAPKESIFLGTAEWSPSSSLYSRTRSLENTQVERITSHYSESGAMKLGSNLKLLQSGMESVDSPKLRVSDPVHRPATNMNKRFGIVHQTGPNVDSEQPALPYPTTNLYPRSRLEASNRSSGASREAESSEGSSRYHREKNSGVHAKVPEDVLQPGDKQSSRLHETIPRAARQKTRQPQMQFFHLPMTLSTAARSRHDSMPNPHTRLRHEDGALGGAILTRRLLPEEEISRLGSKNFEFRNSINKRGPLTFEEMGIPEPEQPEDCIIM